MIENSTFSFKPLSPKRNSEQIAHQIEESIISKRYKPHDRLPTERELATQFNAGRGAVREALRILEGSGFIFVKPGGDGGIFVKELDSSIMTKTILKMVRIGQISIQDVTEIRILLESKVIETIIGTIGEKEIQALESNVLVCETLIHQKIPPIDEIQDFHRLLASFSNNILLAHLVNAIVDLSDSFVKNKLPGMPLSPSHLEHHSSIIKALKQKDIKAARIAIIAHLGSVDKYLKDHYKNGSSQDFVATNGLES